MQLNSQVVFSRTDPADQSEKRTTIIGENDYMKVMLYWLGGMVFDKEVFEGYFLMVLQRGYSGVSASRPGRGNSGVKIM